MMKQFIFANAFPALNMNISVENFSHETFSNPETIHPYFVRHFF